MRERKVSRLKVGDEVMVIAGKSRGLQGKINYVDWKKKRVIVEGANIQTKHAKAQRNGEQGSIKDLEGPIHVSNVALLNPDLEKGVRFRNTSENGTKQRICVKTGKLSKSGQAVNLQQLYFETVSPQLKEEFSIQNVHLIPKISKVTVNVGLGEAVQNPKSIDQATEQLAQIVGQKPVVTRARKSIAGFKLREGMQIGCMVTLRRERMWSFLDRLVQIALPRVKDFRGISPKGFDGKGNYNLGIKEQLIFPEIDFDQIDRIRGMNVSIVTTAQNDQLALSLLKGLGFPFRK